MNRKTLKKSRTIKKNSEFDHILKYGRILQNELFLVAIIREKCFKVGFTTSRGLMAVARNKLKRRIKSLWKEKGNDFIIDGQVVFLVKRRALDFGYRRWSYEFLSLLEKSFKRK